MIAISPKKEPTTNIIVGGKNTLELSIILKYNKTKIAIKISKIDTNEFFKSCFDGTRQTIIDIKK